MQYAPEKHGESHLEAMGLRRPLFPTRAGKYDDNVACQRHHLQTLSEFNNVAPTNSLDIFFYERINKVLLYGGGIIC